MEDDRKATCRGMEAVEEMWDIQYPPECERIPDKGAKVLNNLLKANREMKAHGWRTHKTTVDRIIARFCWYARKRERFWITEEVRLRKPLWQYAYVIIFSKHWETKQLLRHDYYVAHETSKDLGDDENSFTLIMIDELRKVIGEVKFVCE